MNRLFFTAALALLCSFKFNPMSQSISLAEKQKAAQFLIENDSDEAMAIELTVKERVMDDAGKETHPEAKDMSVFPPQIIIPPKDKRTIRVSWSGHAPESERAFRVIAEQLPLKVDQKTKNRSGIQMLMRYMAALYVTPETAEAKLELSVVSADTVLVKNTGTLHRILENPTLTVEHAGKKSVFKASELGGFAGENVLAKSQRLFQVKSREPLPLEAKVTLKLND